MMDHPNIAKVPDAGTIGEAEVRNADFPVGENTGAGRGGKAGWKTGVAGRRTNATLFTAFEPFIGTPACMSPDQAEICGLDITLARSSVPNEVHAPPPEGGTPYRGGRSPQAIKELVHQLHCDPVAFWLWLFTIQITSVI